MPVADSVENVRDLDESYFYSDSDEDLSLLAIVGNPRPTNPNARLREIAVKRGWPIRAR